jgi:hypothetical protein
MKYFSNRTTDGKFCKPYWNVRAKDGKFTSTAKIAKKKK